jgi:hypothetical protein
MSTARILRLAALCALGAATLAVAPVVEAQPRSRTVEVQVAPGFARGEWRHARHPRRVFVQQPVVVQPAPRDHRVFVHVAPPPPRYVQHAPAPQQNVVWIEGYWSWNGAQYVWIEGRWEHARPGFAWVQPEWRHDGNGWYFVEGYWAPQQVQPQPVQPQPIYPQPQPASFEADLVSACSQATVGNGALQQCVQTARPLGAFAAQSIAACSAQTVGNGALEDCLRAIRFARPNVASIVSACGQATVGNGAVVQCIATASAARTDPIPVIQSCSQATVGNGAFQQCIDASLR